jgi:uncharacterized protein YjiS (DUF1127 family)
LTGNEPLEGAMLILHIWRLVRQWARSRRACGAFARLDRHTLADIGIDARALASFTRELGLDRLRRPSHL